MSPIMDSLLRKAPYPEWVLMYRLGLGRDRIAALVRAAPATVGYHLGVARRQDPELEAAHRAAGAAPSLVAVARMEEIIDWVTDAGRLPRGRVADQAERSMEAWIRQRRSEAAAGTLHPSYRDGLARIPGWDTNARTAADEARWQARLAELVRYRAGGNDWPRHHEYDTDEEHVLGVWIHGQRQKFREGTLSPDKAAQLDAAIPGWLQGRTRGRATRP
jgi:Helicase associated domain